MKKTALFAALLAQASLGLSVGLLHAADIDAKKVYKENCERCHGVDGSGTKDGAIVPAAKQVFKSVTLSEAEQLAKLNIKDDEAKKMNDVDLRKMIAEGKEKMPAYNEKFKEAQEKGKLDKATAVDAYIDAMVKYTRQLQAK